MTQTPRPTLVSSARSAGERYRIALVGSATLKGKELAELLPESTLGGANLKLFDDDEALGQIEAVGDEVTFVQRVSRDSFQGVDFAFFASRADFTRRSWRLARDAGAAVVDLSYALENEDGATVRAPWIDRDLGRVPVPELEPGPVIAAHPASVVLALLLGRIHRWSAIRNAAVTIFEPASEYGRPGMDELHQQTVTLLSFQELPRKVFGAQVAFNLMSQLGEPAEAVSLESTEQRIVSHFRTITAGSSPEPSVMLVLAPVFHAYVFSFYVELEKAQTAGALIRALGEEHIDVRRAEDEPPNNVAAAGQEDVLVSVRPDSQRGSGFWIWASADNLRLHALTAVECAQHLSATRPKGKVQ